MLPPLARVGARRVSLGQQRSASSLSRVTSADQTLHGIAYQAVAYRGWQRVDGVGAPRSRGGGSAGGGKGGPDACTREVYTWPSFDASSPDVVYSYRAVNNGHAAVWGLHFSGGWLVRGLLTAFVDGAGELALGAFDSASKVWSVYPGPGAPKVIGGWEAYTPTLSVDAVRGTTHLAWLEHAGGPVPLDVVIVFESTVFGEGTWLGTGLVGIALVLASVWDPKTLVPVPAGLKYLSYAKGDLDAYFACTYFDETDIVAPNDRDLAVFLDGSDWRTEKGAVSDRSSDPSVAVCLPGGVAPYAVLSAWEERDNTGAFPITSPWVKLVRSGVSYGPSQMTQGGRALVGGDPSVWGSSTWLYVAFQGSSGGIYVFRSPYPVGVGTSFVWEPLGVFGGYIDDGFLPNLVGTTVDGVDYLAVVWELTELEFTNNAGKLAALAFLRSDAAGFVIEGTPTTMNLGKVYGALRFQLSPAASIGDAYAWAELGYLPVDVMWVEVVAEEVSDPVERYTVTLMHRRYEWGGPCITF